MRALFGFDPDRGARDAHMSEEFERALGYWGEDYAVQMLRGPGARGAGCSARARASIR